MGGGIKGGGFKTYLNLTLVAGKKNQLRQLQTQFDLVGIEFHPRMAAVQQINFVDVRSFVVYKNLNVLISQQKKIHFVTIVSNGHYKRGVLVERLHTLFQRIFLYVGPRDHNSKIQKVESLKKIKP
jgi:hypothetical protein